MYLPSSSHPALKEFTGFRDGRAVGVQFVRNKNMDPDVSTDITTVRASRLVVVSAGALGSPAILERSGIGARDLLRNLESMLLSISLVSVKATKVRQRYSIYRPSITTEYVLDHNLLSPTYLSSEESSTLDKIIANDTAEIESKF